MPKNVTYGPCPPGDPQMSLCRADRIAVLANQQSFTELKDGLCERTLKGLPIVFLDIQFNQSWYFF
jgi:hypothetical protein